MTQVADLFGADRMGHRIGMPFQRIALRQQQVARVDTALQDIVMQQGGMTLAQAVDYVKQLKKDKRYQRDVY